MNYENQKFDAGKKLIYVASPYAGDIEANVRFAAAACRYVMAKGHAFFAPHLLYPAILDDSVPSKRALGIICCPLARHTGRL